MIRLVRIDHDLAVVWAPFEFLVDGRVDHCGTDLFNLSASMASGSSRVSPTLGGTIVGASRPSTPVWAANCFMPCCMRSNQTIPVRLTTVTILICPNGSRVRVLP